MTPWILLAVLAAAPGTVQETDPVEKSIADLGDENAATRESALQAILSAGPAAIPRLRRALESLDAEVRERAACALGELEREEKLACVMQARPAVTASFRQALFEDILREVGRQSGLRFDGAVSIPDRRLTLSFERAPAMRVLDDLARAAGDLQWSFENEATVYWRRMPPMLRPSAYSGGFRVSLSRLDVYKSWDYQQGHGLLWVYLETRMEPGIRPLGVPRFEVTEIRDDAGNELPRDSEMQEGAPKGPTRDGVGKSSGSIYESSPFTINQLDRSVRKLSRIGGRARFLFPLDRTTVQMGDLCEETSTTRGPLVFQATEILTNSMKLTVSTSGDPAVVTQHLDSDTLVLVDAEGAEHVRGKDFDVRMDQMSADTVRYSIEFNENVCFQPCAVRFVVTERFFEKIVPFEFKDVDLP
jgi:hypothetical protein